MEIPVSAPLRWSAGSARSRPGGGDPFSDNGIRDDFDRPHLSPGPEGGHALSAPDGVIEAGPAIPVRPSPSPVSLRVCAGTPRDGVVVLFSPIDQPAHAGNAGCPNRRKCRPGISALPGNDRPATAGPQRGEDNHHGRRPYRPSAGHHSSSKDSPGIQLLRRVWRDRRIAISVAVVVPATVALLCALAMPRGPLTATQALVTMMAGLLTGGCVALVLRSRWAMALAPAVFVTVYEMLRVGTSGPTVDAMRADAIGIIAVVVGRGVHGLLALVPMILGAAYGAALARRWCDASSGAGRRGRISHWTRRIAAGLVTVGLVALAFVIAVPPPHHQS